MKKYCEVCGKETATKVVTKTESYEILHDRIEVDAKILVCSECDEEQFDEVLDNETLVNAYNIYRRKHKLLLPEEIRSIREQYGLSQRRFSKLLNWGDKTICRYENGSLQDKVHNSLLLFLREPENMHSYLMENEITIGPKNKMQLLKVVEVLEKKTENTSINHFIESLFSSEPSVDNGFRIFDYDKLTAMVLYFAHSQKGLLKTKLLKLLHYSDMIFYQENGISISGTKYIHLPYGPVPDSFDLILGVMSTNKLVHIDIAYDNGYEFHQVIPERSMPEGVLSEDEITVLEKISKKFARFGSVEISNYSHREAGYQATSIGETIPYTYAKDMELSGL